MLDRLTLDQMRMFVAVAEAGSFRAAARSLGRVQSAVSHSVANLETELGLRLFDRSTRKPELTAEGRSLLADMRQAIGKVDAMRGRAHALGQGVELEIALALDPQFPLPVLAEAAAELQGRHPGIALRVLSTPLGASLDALLAGDCDLALSGADMIHPAVEVEALGQVLRAAVAAPSHPLAQEDGGLSTAQLAEHVQIVVEDSSERTNGRDHGVVSPARWRVADNLTKKALILAGTGWGSLPLWMVDGELTAGRLVRLPVAAFAPDGETTVEICLAWRADRPLGPGSSVLRDALKRALARTD